MAIRLSQDSQSVLHRYVKGQLSNPELAEWLVQVEYDQDIPQDERDDLAQLRLIVTEAEEQIRPVEQILEKVAAMLVASDPRRQVIARRTSSSTDMYPGRVVTAAGSRVRHAGITP